MLYCASAVPLVHHAFYALKLYGDVPFLALSLAMESLQRWRCRYHCYSHWCYCCCGAFLCLALNRPKRPQIVALVEPTENTKQTQTMTNRNQISKIVVVMMRNAKILTSWSILVAGAGVPGAGDIGSGVFAPLDWLSMRRFARDRVLYGNFKNVVNRFRSSANARSWRCAYASLLISSSDVGITGVDDDSDGTSAAGAAASGASSVFSDFDSWKCEKY